MHLVRVSRRAMKVGASTAGLGLLAAGAFHAVHIAMAAATTTTWLYTFIDLPYTAARWLGPGVKWGATAAGAGALAYLATRARHAVGRRVVVFYSSPATRQRRHAGA